MLFLIGLVVVVGAIAGGYGSHGGNFAILWQPSEFIIIGGSGVGAFIIATPGHVIKRVLKALKWLLKKNPYEKKDYIELLCFMYTMNKTMKMKGMLEMEKHIEDPEQSDIFAKFHGVQHNHHAVEFFADNVRLLTMGLDDPYQMEDLMNEQLEAHHHDGAAIGDAVTNMADSFPALGIVAAVLGVITTMQSITEPPEVLGGLIGAALVGTFLGVLLAYGIVGPIAKNLGNFAHAEGMYYEVMKVALLAHMKGNAPTVSVEFARKKVPEHVRPSFKEQEEAINQLSSSS